MASDAGLDQSFLCAIERGRRRIYSAEQLHAIGRAARLTPGQEDELLWAWAHDRVIHELQAVGLSLAAQRIVSSALRAERTLEQAELRGLERLIEQAVRSKHSLTSLMERGPLDEAEVLMS